LFTDLRVTDLIQLAYRETKTKFAEAEDGLCRKIAIKLVARKNVRGGCLIFTTIFST